MTIHLLSDPSIASQLSVGVVAGVGRVLVVVEGDRELCAWPTVCRDSASCQLCRRVAPERFRVLDTKCERCAGRGRIEADHWDRNDPDNHLGWITCPSCAGGGREVWEFHTTCPTYGETHVGYSDISTVKAGAAKKRGGGSGACELDPPCVRGSVQVCRASVQVLPVTHHETADDDIKCCGYPHVFGTWKRSAGVEGHDLIFCDGNLPNPETDYITIDCDPLPTPGADWVVVFEVVS